MDDDLALPCGCYEFARFVMPQIKRRSTSFLIMSAAHPLTRQGLRMVGNGKDNEIL